ncbi:MAG: 4-alpha-glucanotransferase, partial [Candidatus Theseobacter exili]|nr:4-alpha-glucanotransferase [Candidatus Theseobacter exili]
YADFMAIKELHNHEPWPHWGPFFLDYSSWTLQRNKLVKRYPDLEKSIGFYKYIQFCFFNQWKALKKYSEEKGRMLFGDMPWYVGLDSSDVWANKELFELDKNGLPINVAGVPPDYFSHTGQLWGNPLYNWKNIKTLEWWVDAMELQLSMLDILRIDHFRAIDTFWKIPYNWATSKGTATEGFWEKGPAETLLNSIKERLNYKKSHSQLPIVAENLGYLDPLYATIEDYPSLIAPANRYKVSPRFSCMMKNQSCLLGNGFNPKTGEYNTRQGIDSLLSKFDLPGMRVLQFGFEDLHKSNSNNQVSNLVVYTGTHDNNTTLGWYNENHQNNPDSSQESLGDKILDYLDSNMHLPEIVRPCKDKKISVCWNLIEIAFRSDSFLAGAPLQDFLELGEEARMNKPGDTRGTWWTWRATLDQLDFTNLARAIIKLNEFYGRVSL